MHPRIRIRPTNLIAAVAAVVGLAGIWAGVFAYEAATYRSMVGDAYLESERSAHRLAVHTALTLAEIERVIMLVKFEHEHDPVLDLAGLGRAGLLGAADEVVVTTTDRDGRVTASTRMADAATKNYSDARAWQRARDEPGFVLEKPAIGRVQKRWVVPAALRLVDGQGRFDGVVIAAINTEALTRGFRHDDDPATAISVIGRDGIYRSRRVGSRHVSGDDIGPAAVAQMMIREGRRSEPVASYVDHILRYPATVPIPGTDWLAAVAASAAPSLARHAEFRKLLYGGGLAGSALLLIVVAAWVRLAQRLDVAAAERQHHDKLRQTILDAIPSAIALSDPSGRIAVANLGWQRRREGAQDALAADADLLEVYRETFGPDAQTLPAIAARFQAARQGSDEVEPIEYLGTCAGVPQWHRLTLLAVHHPTGHLVLAISQDIHERKTAEETLRRSAVLARVAGRVARIGGWTIAAGSDDMVFSDELCEIYDLPNGQVLRLEDWIAWFASDARATIGQALRQCMADGMPFDAEIEASTSAGRSFWSRCIVSAVRDEHGEIVALHGAVQDVTEQHRAQDRARLMETCISRMNDMVVVTEAQPTELPGPRIVFVNDALLKLTGFRRDEVIGKTPRIFQGPGTSRSELDRIADALRRRAPVRAELANYSKSGEEYWVELDIQPVFDDRGEAVYFMSVERDITQRRRDRLEMQRLNRNLEAMVAARTAQLEDTHAVLLEREHEISAVLQNMADCVISIDQGGSVRSANDSVRSLFGYEPVELIGRPLSVVLENGGRGAMRMAGRRENKAIGPPVVATGLHRSGERFAVEMAFTHYVVNDEERTTVIVRDIRERMRDLAELQQARLRAEDASRAKSAFLASMSHEIRTPMNGVVGMIDVLRETRLSGDQSQMLELARESAYSLMEVIESVLDFSKIEAGKVEVEMASMSLPEVVGKVFDLAFTLGHKRGVHMSLFIDPAIPDAVVGDAVKIRQVVLNLLSNAIKFCSAGDVTGEVELRAVLAHRQGDELKVSISVRDNGIGMDEQTLGRLFQSFTQADASTTRRFGGTGLGLTIARDLTRLMGGDIAVASQLAQGSTFTVRLPLKAAPGAAANKPAVFAAGERVVVVGGEAGFVGDLGAYLRHAGARVTAVANLASLHAGASAVDHTAIRLCVFVGAGQVEDVMTLRSTAEPPMLRTTPWVAVLADGPREPRLVSVGMVVVGQATLTLGRLGSAATMAREGGQDAVVQGWLAPTAPAALAKRVGPLRDIDPILIAEDNEINQRVLSAQLDLLGYPCRIAADGTEALRLWQTGRHSMVLTDLHMPQMDGFSLVAAIRTAEAPGQRIPIVALTANALKHEADRCLAAGMDGYATKPLTFEILQGLLTTWIPEAGSGPAPGGAVDAPDPASPRPPIDVDVLSSMVGTDPDVIQEFLGRFRAASLRTESTVVAACERSDWLEASDHVHQLKSSARAFGAFTLATVCESLESACISAEVSRIGPLLADLRAEISVLNHFLEHRLSGYAGADATRA